MKLPLITTLSEIYSRNLWKKKKTPANEKGLEPRNLNFYTAYGVYQQLTARINGGGINTPVFGDLARARFIPILPCNILRGWVRIIVTAPPPSTFSLIVYKWTGAGDVIVNQVVFPDMAQGDYFLECDCVGQANSLIDPLLGEGFYMLLSVTNTTIWECGIDYKITERRLIP